MAASGRSAVRRTGRILAGFGALVVLCAVLVGAPVALLALAGNPLPDHLPTLAEIGSTLTSRDDGRLFLRALALAGWFGWATFAFSVLVELGAQALRRPAPRLPGLSRQQRAAAALVGSVALILTASPAASAATAVAGPYALPAAPAATAPTSLEAARPAPGTHTARPAPAAQVARPAPAAWLTSAAADAPDEGGAVYRVARGDHLGTVAERYLDEFADYRELAELNRLGDPDRIHPGQLLRLPGTADDGGARRHATGRLVARPTPPEPDRPTPRPAPEQAAPEQAAPEQAAPEQTAPEQTAPDRTAPEWAAPSAPAGVPVPPPADVDTGAAPPVTVGAARAGEPDRVNRPLAVSAVLAVASIVGAQIGAVLGRRRRPASVPAGSGRSTAAARRATTATGRDGARTKAASTARAHAIAIGRGSPDIDPGHPTGRHRRP